MNSVGSALRQRAKRVVLPRGNRVRNIRFGIARGTRMRFDLHNGQLRLYLGLYEIELASSIRRLCRPGVPSYDLGAQYGYDGLAFAHLTRAPVLCVESQQELCPVISRNVAANPSIADFITVRHAFVGCGHGETTIDDLVAATFAPRFVKLDVEGSEVKALLGAQELLSTERPSLIVEVHSWELENECIDILRSHNYRITTVDPRRWLPDHRPTAHNRWLVGEPHSAG